MHEIGLCESILGAVTQRAEGRRVNRVKVRIGVRHGVAEPALKQGFALVALGKYHQASKVLKQGLKIAPEWPRSGFRVEALYGNNRAAKTAHLGTLSQAVAAKPSDADLPFVLGVFVHFGGEADRAAFLFERAARVSAGNDAHLAAFSVPGRPAWR